jgi:hypothetical protein
MEPFVRVCPFSACPSFTGTIQVACHKCLLLAGYRHFSVKVTATSGLGPGPALVSTPVVYVPSSRIFPGTYGPPRGIWQGTEEARSGKILKLGLLRRAARMFAISGSTAGGETTTDVPAFLLPPHADLP